jgi:hypothetical protein
LKKGDNRELGRINNNRGGVTERRSRVINKKNILKKKLAGFKDSKNFGAAEAIESIVFRLT